MKIKGNEYNFGRIVYLTLFRYSGGDSGLQKTEWTEEKTKNGITICFDPSREGDQFGQLTTRIDFFVKHVGDAAIGNNGYFATANIDVYNIGPALTQFLNAYNAYKSEGHFKGTDTQRYALVLQVGYKGNPKRTTIFAGRISSFVMERQLGNTTVDNVWHFFCQFPTADGSGEVGSDKAQNGVNYAGELGDTFAPMQTYTSWEDYLKTVICSRRREIFTEVGADENLHKYSFETDVELKNNAYTLEDMLAGKSAPELEQSQMVVKPQTVAVNFKDFDKYFKIEYRVCYGSKELPTVKEFWQQKVPVQGWNINSDNVQKIAKNIARATNCHARVELRGAKQIIYIYPSGWQPEFSGDPKFIIKDYQNLRKPPQVAANMLQLDMMMEPSIRPGDIIELQITEGFLKEHPHPTFQVAYSNSMANATTVFAGASFIGMHEMSNDDKHKKAIASAGNVFNTKYVATFVEFHGSTHTNEWSTKVDCYGVAS